MKLKATCSALSLAFLKALIVSSSAGSWRPYYIVGSEFHHAAYFYWYPLCFGCSWWWLLMWNHLKDRYGEPEGGSEWEPIKIIFQEDGGSNKMNTALNTRLRLTTQVGQDHAATGVLLTLGTNNQPHRPENAAEHKPRALLTNTSHVSEHHRSDRSLLVKPGDFHRTAPTLVRLV
jgi:hypothetical protein